MDLNSNFRKRRLLEDIVSSSNSPPAKRDASTSTSGSKPMTLDTYTQTEISIDETCKAQNLEAQVNQILRTLSRHESLLTEIYDLLRKTNTQSSTNLNYKIIANGDDAITIEAVKADDIIEEPLQSPSGSTYVEEHYEINDKSISQENRVFNNSNNPPIAVANFQSHENHQMESPAQEFTVKQENTNRRILAEQPPDYAARQAPSNLEQDESLPDEAPEMVAIGPNGTCVSKKVLESIKWDSASFATRKLLTSVFNRKTLATHSLTGRPSPAFHGRDKPAKDQLDAGKVTDIIHIVSKFCNVPEKEVRSSITTKCADENKMYNQRIRRELNKENFGHNPVCRRQRLK